jgi:hypothetical protein
METKLGQIIKKAVIFHGIIFTLATLVSSILQLSQGQETDTNVHIIDRAVLCLIGVIMFTLVDNVKFKIRLLSYVIPYVISMPIVMFYTWLTSFWAEQHPNAYKDIFLNFTMVFIVVSIFITIKDYFKARKSNPSK